jgi:hypothetical protein
VFFPFARPHDRPPMNSDPRPGRNGDSSSAPPEELGPWIARLSREFGAVGRAAQRRAVLGVYEAKLTLFEALLWTVGAVIAALLSIGLALTAAVLIVGSLRAGLAAASGGAWWSDLLLGLALLGALTAAAVALRRRFEERVLRGARRALGLDVPPPPVAPPVPTPNVPSPHAPTPNVPRPNVPPPATPPSEPTPAAPSPRPPPPPPTGPQS